MESNHGQNLLTSADKWRKETGNYVQKTHLEIVIFMQREFETVITQTNLYIEFHIEKQENGSLNYAIA